MLDAEQALAIPEGATAAEANVQQFYRGNPDLIPVALAAGTAQDVDGIAVSINHARWIVECPSGDGGAQYASREDQRFMCLECLNADIGGKWRPVLWPGEAQQIEAVLAERPVQANQNWLPTETLEDLQAENDTHLDPPPAEPTEETP